MYSPTNDLIGKSLIAIFLIKPIVDLFWWFGVPVAGVNITPLTTFGAFVFLYFLGFRLQRGRHKPPFTRIFEIFLLMAIAPPIIRVASGEEVPLTDVIDISLRIIDSYLIYSAAYLAGSKYQYDDFTPLIKAIVLGSGIAVVINVIAIQLGFGGAKAEDILAGAPLREKGLYYDPGAMSNVAVYSLIFTVFMFSVIKTNKAVWYAFGILVVFCDLYLIVAGKSRSGVIQLMAFGLLYFSLFQRSWGRILAPAAAAVVILIATVSFNVDYDDFFGRFGSDIASLEEKQDGAVGITDSGTVSLGKYEGLGNRRGAMWAKALTEIVQRDFDGILFGEFTRSVAHSDIIDVLARSGVIGFILYVMLMVGLPLKAYGLLRRSQADSIRVLHFMSFSLLVAYVLYSIPFRPLNYTTTSWYMWAIVGLSMARISVIRRKPPARAAEPAAEVEADKPAPATPPPSRRPAPSWRPTRPLKAQR